MQVSRRTYLLVADSGRYLVAALPEIGRDYGAVLLDQKMPGIDGLQTLKRLKARVPDACVVMATSG